MKYRVRKLDSNFSTPKIKRDLVTFDEIAFYRQLNNHRSLWFFANNFHTLAFVYLYRRKWSVYRRRKHWKSNRTSGSTYCICTIFWTVLFLRHLKILVTVFFCRSCSFLESKYYDASLICIFTSAAKSWCETLTFWIINRELSTCVSRFFPRLAENSPDSRIVKRGKTAREIVISDS